LSGTPSVCFRFDYKEHPEMERTDEQVRERVEADVYE